MKSRHGLMSMVFFAYSFQFNKINDLRRERKMNKFLVGTVWATMGHVEHDNFGIYCSITGSYFTVQSTPYKRYRIPLLKRHRSAEG